MLRKSAIAALVVTASATPALAVDGQWTPVAAFLCAPTLEGWKRSYAGEYDSNFTYRDYDQMGDIVVGEYLFPDGGALAGVLAYIQVEPIRHRRADGRERRDYCIGSLNVISRP